MPSPTDVLSWVLGCKSCNTGKFPHKAICRCCQLVDNDSTLKQVKYCKVCKVYLCRDCWGDVPKRIVAFGRQFF